MSLSLRDWFIVWLVWMGWRWYALTRDCYDHVQEVIRADAHAGQHTIRAKERVAMRGQRSDDALRGLYQPTVVTPVRPWRHVVLLPGPLFVLLPFRPFLRGVVVHWTPLVRYPTPEWLEELSDAVAHFLGLGRGKVDLAEANVTRKRARIVRASA